MIKYKLGIDVGGTFTDFFLVDEKGRSVMHKTLSTPEDSSVGFIRGMEELAEKLQIKTTEFIDGLDTIVHGTTVATNTLLTQAGARTALITTRGLRDALEMRRGIREEQYNNHYRNVTPIVPRKYRFTVDERIDAKGQIVQPFDLSDLDGIIESIKKEKIEAIAVCFMNSYLNYEHEIQATRCLREYFPDLFICASYEVLPSVRFYERLSTTCVNAYVGVVVNRYLQSLQGKLEKLNFKGKLLIMQSNGGVVTPEVACKTAAVTALSGPAAAPIAGAYYSTLLGYENCITMDMGGTSFDASLVVNRQCVTSTDGEINRYRIALPMLDIVTIGAGGGSIGWIDDGGLLQMGPKSAGALPGPISYDREGEEPTCTDADLILGYLDPNFFAGGKYKLNKEKAVEFTEKKLGKSLDMDSQNAAAGMYRVINMNMAQGVREVSIERGYDPREFLMICAGGAGSIHAGEICRELEIPMFVVPNVASIFCAAGMLLGDLKHDYVRSYLSIFSELKKEKFLSHYAEMKTEASNTLIEEGIDKNMIRFVPLMDLRYVGQYHEVSLELSMDEIDNVNLGLIKEAFHKEHNRLYGYELSEEGTELEVINLRLRAIGPMDKPASLSYESKESNASLKQSIKGKRSVYIPELDEMKEVTVYDGDNLKGSFVIDGPAVIEQINTTIFLGETYNCQTGIGGAFIVYNKILMPEGIEKNKTNLIVQEI
jgi:N-methylhydantoinase A